MIKLVVTLTVLGIACGLLQRSALNRDEDISDMESPVKKTPADILKDSITQFSLGLSAGFTLSFSIASISMALSAILLPFTIPALLLSAFARASYVAVATSFMASSAFLLGNLAGYKLATRTESNPI